MSIELSVILGAAAVFFLGVFVSSALMVQDDFDLEFTDYRHPPIAVALEILQQRLHKYKVALCCALVLLVLFCLLVGWLLWTR